MFWPSQNSQPQPSVVLVAAKARRSSNVAPTAPAHIQRAWETLHIARETKSNFGKHAARSCDFAAAIHSSLRNSTPSMPPSAKKSAAPRRCHGRHTPGPEHATLHVYSTRRPATAPATEPAPGERQLTFGQATLEALTHAMAADPTIFVMGEGIGKRGGNFVTTKGLYDIHGPERLCDTPICERGFVGLSCGAAMTGTRPVIDFMFADFVLDSVGEIVNQIAKMQYMSSGRLAMPVLLRGCIGIGHSAATHHSGSYHSVYGQVPGLRVAVPSNAYDAKGLLTRALRCDDPVMFLEHRELLNTRTAVPSEDYEIPFGCGRLVQPGHDVTVVALARMVHLAQHLLPELSQAGISVELIDPRTVSPLDTELILQSVKKTGRLLIVEETPAAFGLGAEVAAQIADAGFDFLDAPIRRLNGAFAPTPYSPSLEAAVVPSSTEIATAIRQLVNE
ncbi:MAG UNVERIFIED_CONTAM: alpha-ketoacid dehydrogenase subunit beta [Planctomycetaceae bacterium]